MWFASPATQLVANEILRPSTIANAETRWSPLSSLVQFLFWPQSSACNISMAFYSYCLSHNIAYCHCRVKVESDEPILSHFCWFRQQLSSLVQERLCGNVVQDHASIQDCKVGLESLELCRVGTGSTLIVGRSLLMHLHSNWLFPARFRWRQCACQFMAIQVGTDLLNWRRFSWS